MFFFVATLLLAPNLLFADGSSENTCNSNPSYFQSASGGGSNTCSSSISGSDEVTKSETYQYSIANAVGDVRWCVEGVGVGIDAGGLVTLGGDACGAFSVSADDSYGTVSKDVRVTDAGKWQAIESCFCELCQY
ncbi:MAG: hypothetical protein HY805_02015 [Nitrospirae bacterium]|nr:hypothetical protein [Nitrospirota bacterium]